MRECYTPGYTSVCESVTHLGIPPCGVCTPLFSQRWVCTPLFSQRWVSTSPLGTTVVSTSPLGTTVGVLLPVMHNGGCSTPCYAQRGLFPPAQCGLFPPPAQCGLSSSWFIFPGWVILFRVIFPGWINLPVMTDKPATERSVAQGGAVSARGREERLMLRMLRTLGYTGARNTLENNLFPRGNRAGTVNNTDTESTFVQGMSECEEVLSAC